MWCHRSSTSCSGNAVTIPWRPAPWKILAVPRASWKRATTWRMEAWKCLTNLWKFFLLPIPSQSIQYIEQNGFPKAMVRVSHPCASILHANPPCWKRPFVTQRRFWIEKLLRQYCPSSICLEFQLHFGLDFRLQGSYRTIKFFPVSSKTCRKIWKVTFVDVGETENRKMWHWTTIGLMPCLIKFNQIPHAVALFFPKKWRLVLSGWSPVTKTMMYDHLRGSCHREISWKCANSLKKRSSHTLVLDELGTKQNDSENWDDIWMKGANCILWESTHATATVRDMARLQRIYRNFKICLLVLRIHENAYHLSEIDASCMGSSTARQSTFWCQSQSKSVAFVTCVQDMSIHWDNTAGPYEKRFQRIHNQRAFKMQTSGKFSSETPCSTDTSWILCKILSYSNRSTAVSWSRKIAPQERGKTISATSFKPKSICQHLGITHACLRTHLYAFSLIRLLPFCRTLSAIATSLQFTRIGSGSGTPSRGYQHNLAASRSRINKLISWDEGQIIRKIKHVQETIGSPGCCRFFSLPPSCNQHMKINRFFQGPNAHCFDPQAIYRHSGAIE